MKFIDSLLNRNESLVLFILIVACNFVGDIFSCDFRRMISSSMLLKHVTSLFLFYVFVVNIENNKVSPFNNMKTCLFLYILFIIMMRTSLWTLTINMCLIFLNYFIQTFKNYHYEKDSKMYNILTNIQRYVIIVNIIITIVSFIYRLYKLEIVLGDHFNIYKYMLGIPDKECLSSSYTISEILKRQSIQNNFKQSV